MSWKKVKLGDVTNNHDSMRIPLNEMQRKEKESQELYPYIGANNVLGYIDEYIFDEKILCIAEDGGSWGKNQKCSFIVNEKCWVNNHAHVITAKNVVCLEYLMNYLNDADLNKYITGTTRGKLTKSALNSIEIPLPALSIQQKIAAILDQADALRKKGQFLLDKYDELLQGVFYDMFGDPVRNEKGWKKVKLGSLCDLVSSCSTPLGGAKVYQNEGIMFIRSQNVLMNEFDISDVSFISKEIHDRMKRTWVKHNDVLLNITGASIGRVAVYKGNDNEANVNQHVSIVRLIKERMSSIFLSYLIATDNFQSKYIGASQGGTREAFTFTSIKSFDVILPTISLQIQFTNIVESIQQQKERVKKQVVQSENLFQSLLQRAFRGELVK